MHAGHCSQGGFCVGDLVRPPQQPSAELAHDIDGLPRVTCLSGGELGFEHTCFDYKDAAASFCETSDFQSFTIGSKTMTIHRGLRTYESHAPPRRGRGVPVSYHSVPAGKTNRQSF